MMISRLKKILIDATKNTRILQTNKRIKVGAVI